MSKRTFDSAKRMVDFVVSAALLFLFFPIMLLVAFLVWMSLGRPIFFHQLRVGLDERPFQIIKFRTMREAVEAKSPHDNDRTTRIGRFLRATSLDELPQLVNVFRGEMSLVGPRPLLLEYLPLYSVQHRRRHSVRPGLTGLAQVSGRNLLNWKHRLDLDIHYVDSRCLALDLRILASTTRLLLSWSAAQSNKEVSMPRLQRDYLEGLD